ncbi:Uncharacterized protein Anas_06476 [Armadillidium nasatum]|uniref:FAS1 domain-containing protein n=1 Tax=Armadillidium nasatum TaxID=96803 RepID=A0A5N5SVL4_9CRUS|nr:Uncharacterized protein Anas_06476 [Armadillidium nasatum]
MFLQANERENILLHHIVSGLITSDQIINGTAVLTLGGNNITFSINVVNMTLIVKANDANLIDFDINASNGVIHVVDQLLLPPSHDNRLAMLQTPQYEKEPEPLPNNIIEMAESIGLTSMTEYLADAGLALPLSMKGTSKTFILFNMSRIGDSERGRKSNRNIEGNECKLKINL